MPKCPAIDFQYGNNEDWSMCRKDTYLDRVVAQLEGNLVKERAMRRSWSSIHGARVADGERDHYEFVATDCEGCVTVVFDYLTIYVMMPQLVLLVELHLRAWRCSCFSVDPFESQAKKIWDIA
jgi:hypothetical protein